VRKLATYQTEGSAKTGVRGRGSGALFDLARRPSALTL